MKKSFGLLVLFTLAGSDFAQEKINNMPISQVWVSDTGDGAYKNPVLYADYSDPDAIRVGHDFYMTASSFNCVPGLPILHSQDLVNWRLIGHALSRLQPEEPFNKPQHGNGVWAPAIRFHNDEYYIYYPDPDYGIYLLKAQFPAGPWSEPILVKKARGWIDPCPLWDSDGKAYLVSALAASRAGIKSVLIISRLSSDGSRVLDDGVIVFDGHAQHPTVEGPKLYKRNGYYYIFAPAGGVPNGWQLVLRAKNIYGPYAEKIVLAQGRSTVNGPHQGAWVDAPDGSSWFLHFQDQDLYGRVVHLQPMQWLDDWPVMGIDADHDGCGEPVLRFQKPVKSTLVLTPAESDEFDTVTLGLQWQWHTNPQPNWHFPAGSMGFLRLYCVSEPLGGKNLWDTPNLLLQKFPALEFTATVKMDPALAREEDKIGLLIMGLDYGYVALVKIASGMAVCSGYCKDADKGNKEVEILGPSFTAATLYLRVQVSKGGACAFSYSTDNCTFTPIGDTFQARKGRWIGAKVGLFALGPTQTGEMGYADIDWFRIGK